MSMGWTSAVAGLALLAVGRLSETTPPVSLAAQQGQSATLRVQLATRDTLVSHEAPNRLTLTTPWSKTQVQPSGTRHSNPAFASYFAQVKPMTFKVSVPASVKPGNYPAQLGGELFVCDMRDKVCTLRPVQVPVHIRVGATAQIRSTTLTLRDQDLKPRGRRL
ncbi:MAG: hypothetical protein Q4C89_11980 [Deinococcus sp.]|uniref:hypothetical protein n=1 Tax=Deinococcus sp. TaxID=47478 RepID=UPI0026DD5BD3|nr:hypothetical protein [Deinococcus sp.]MDO4246733.1 hypothetical protein [Deinococcus sp.]